MVKLRKTEHMKIIQDIETKGWCELAYSYQAKKSIHNALEAWKQFCSLSLEQKQAHTFGFEGGYEYKDSKQLDYKENFHYSLLYKPAFTMQDSRELNFLSSSCHLMQETVVPLVQKIAHGFQVISGSSVNFEQLLDADRNRWTLRYLHYPENKNPDNQFLSFPRTDKNISIHLMEDAPGLEILWNGTWHTAAPQEEYALVYPGMNAQYYSKCKLTATCHRVRAMPANRKGRYSLVAFLDFGDIVYDKEAYGSTHQNFSKGENYKMSFEEFRTYFTNFENAVL